jgi:hypothetical protein
MRDAHNKLTASYQSTWQNNPIFATHFLANIDEKVTLHKEAASNVLSSVAACVNVLAGINSSTADTKHFFA